MSDTSAAVNRPKYFAFLSYAHKDARTAAALSRYLETFRVPVKLGGKEQLPKRMYPIFRDRDEFSASADLGAAIRDALASSGALIVLCSPDAARSKWVDAEIRTFRQIGDPTRIFPVLLEGAPGEAFPSALTESGEEPLAVDFRPHEDATRDARLRLAAALLAIDFDALKRREAARVRNARVWNASLAALAGTAVACAFILGPIISRATQPKITEYPVPTRYSMPSSITVGPDGALWFTEFNRGKIGRLSISAHGHVTITEYPVPVRDSQPVEITAGPNDALWFTDGTRYEIGRVSIETRGRVSISEYPLPGRPLPMTGMVLQGITAGPGDTVWFTDVQANKIGCVRIGADGHVNISEYNVPTPNSEPYDIAAGSNRELWFTERGSGRIGLVKVAATNHVLVYDYPLVANTFQHSSDACWPEGITAARDGALWLAESECSAIGKALIERGRPVLVAEYPTLTNGSEPTDITVGPDGGLWFTELGANKIGRVGIEGHGPDVITEYTVPTSNSGPTGIVAGPDGALWFAQYTFFGNEIGRISTGGFRQLMP
jgi:virginiamycin B lyase